MALCRRAEMNSLMDLVEANPLDIERYLAAIHNVDPITANGRIKQIIGLTIESAGPEAQIGEYCTIRSKHLQSPVGAEVVGFRGDRVLLMPLGEMDGVGPGSEVVASGHSLRVPVGPSLLGRVLDGLGRPIDGKEPPEPEAYYPVSNAPPAPLSRRRITQHLGLGVRAIDGLMTIGRGQRVGVFSGSGVGKSTLMGIIARNTEADVNVVGLIGERGREVRDFIERDLGEEGLERSVVVVATSDQPALVRLKGAFAATAIAEYFRDQGKDVMLMMDSVTRFAMAQREVGLAIGEPPATRGYTPSVFAQLPKLLERSGTSSRGSITGLYTVLVDGDDMNEPIADATRGILDGHIILSRRLASKNHYPAIDINSSLSRLMVEITDDDHQQAASMLREVLSTYSEAEDLINIGAYNLGSNPKIDDAIDRIEAVNGFLRQGIYERSTFADAVTQLKAVFS